MSGNLLDEWLAKAEENFRVAIRENRYTEFPAHDTVCFNAQQCAEKYLKAFLIRQRMPVPKTHDLDDLRQRCEAIDSNFTLIANPLRGLYRSMQWTCVIRALGQPKKMRVRRLPR